MTLRVITPSGNGGVRSVLPVNPFGFLQREIDRLFENFTGGSEAAGQAQVTLVPSMDVIETETEILIAAEMPGLQRDDVQITIADDVLTIRGEKRPERKEEGDKDKRYQGERTKLRRVLAFAPAAGRRGSIVGGGDHVEWCAEDQDPQASAQPTQKDRGQRCRSAARGERPIEARSARFAAKPTTS